MPLFRHRSRRASAGRIALEWSNERPRDRDTSRGLSSMGYIYALLSALLFAANGSVWKPRQDSFPISAPPAAEIVW